MTGRGRPWKPRRSVLNGILWVLRTGAPWSDLPDRYPSYQICHRRFQQWVRSGIMRGVLEALAEDLRIRGRPDVRDLYRWQTWTCPPPRVRLMFHVMAAMVEFELALI